MKNFLKLFLIGSLFFIIVPIIVHAQFYPFVSSQLAPSPTNGSVLQTNGSTSTWVATSSLGITQDLSNYVTFLYSSSTFPSFTYASSTFVSFSYASSTFPSFAYASSTFPSFTYGSSTYLSQISAASTYVPYTGAIGNIDLNNKYLSNVGQLLIGTSTNIANFIAYISGNLGIGTTTGISTEYRITSASGNYSRYALASTSDNMNLYNQVSVLSADGTGGTITHSGGYTIHTFTSNGTFTPVGVVNAQVLVVAGGGGGGNSGNGGGGGAGGVIASSSVLISSAQTITVGAGGGAITSGATSSIGSLIVAIGGGRGGSYAGAEAGASGGSGGGGANNAAGGSGTSGQGFAGGNGYFAGNPFGGGGGGGATAIGVNANSSGAGDGGAGLTSSITGSSITYGCGGGGGGYSPNGNRAGNGGCSGAGAGGFAASQNGFAATGYGSGGGGAAGGGGNIGGAGFQGIVIIKYQTSATNQEVSIINSKDSAVAGEYGVNTFGANLGATHLNGNALYFDINGTNYGYFASTTGALTILSTSNLATTTVIGNFYSDDIQAVDSAGVLIKNSGGSNVASIGLANTLNSAFFGGLTVATTLGVTGTSTLATTTATKLGVGTTTPTTALSVVGTSTTNELITTIRSAFGNNAALTAFSSNAPQNAAVQAITTLPTAFYAQGLYDDFYAYATTSSVSDAYAADYNGSGRALNLFSAGGAVHGASGSLPFANISTQGTPHTGDVLSLLSGFYGSNFLEWDGNGQKGVIQISTGNMGIGTTTPQRKLTVVGDQRLTGAFGDSTNATGTVGSLLTSTGTSTLWISPSYGGLVEFTPASTTGSTSTLTTVGVFYPWTGASSTLSTVSGTGYVTASSSYGATSTLTIGANGGGIYEISFSGAIQLNASNDIIHCALFKNNVQVPNVSGETKIINSTDEKSIASGPGFVSLSSGDVLNISCSDETVGGNVLTFNHINFGINRISL